MIRLVTTILLLGALLYLTGCSGCSRSGSHQPRRAKRSAGDAPAERAVRTSAERPGPATQPTLKQIGSGPTEVPMERKNGVYRVPVIINGIAMKFILDTGASLISMSATEAESLQTQGAISETDIIGQSRFQDATGTISPGAIIRLKSVQIGDRVLENVNANVVAGAQAPLLLGQSALSQFGKISVDYRRNVVTFD